METATRYPKAITQIAENVTVIRAKEIEATPCSRPRLPGVSPRRPSQPPQGAGSFSTRIRILTRNRSVHTRQELNQLP
ncbi:MAG: hypothetical protein U9O82_07175 [Thermodesulfobacteriota bacterium]|nr:hypothetical protein [Thermodesulfobacteriota bacterium]